MVQVPILYSGRCRGPQLHLFLLKFKISSEKKTIVYYREEFHRKNRLVASGQVD